MAVQSGGKDLEAPADSPSVTSSIRPSHRPLLDPEHAAFIQRGVSIVAASRDPSNTPMVARAVGGCRVSADRQQVRLFFWAPQCEALLECFRATGTMAAVFSEVETHRTIQLKGDDVREARVTPADRRCMALYRDALTRGLKSIGFSEAFARALLYGESETMVAAVFTPTAIFEQTPGPRAGEPLKQVR